MINLTDELKEKLLSAANVEEVTTLLEEAGREITVEEATQLWEEIKLVKDQGVQEFSKDELDAVSGGHPPFEMPENCAAFFGGGRAYDDPRDRDHKNKKDDPSGW